MTVPGVQRFVGEARSTADVASASGIVSDLTAAMVAEVTASSEVVRPAGGRGSRQVFRRGVGAAFAP
ncbi:hypothetical protein [Dactylosporangium cerinum]